MLTGGDLHEGMTEPYPDTLAGFSTWIEVQTMREMRGFRILFYSDFKVHKLVGSYLYNSTYSTVKRNKTSDNQSEIFSARDCLSTTLKKS